MTRAASLFAILVLAACGDARPPPASGGHGGGGAEGDAGSGGGGGGAGGHGGSGGSAECSPGQTESCYSGLPSTEGVGECRAGIKNCRDGSWSTCEGEVTPATEDPCNLRDEDCDGINGERTSECYGAALSGGSGSRLESANVHDFLGNLTNGSTIATNPGQYDGKVAFVQSSRAVVRMIPGIPSSDGERSLGGILPYLVSLQPGTETGAIGFATPDTMFSRIDGNRNVRVSGTVDGMARDPFGFRWVSTDEPALYRLSGGLVTLDGETGPGLPLPRAARGLTVDDRGILWTGSSPSLRIEPHGVTWEEVPHSAEGRPFAYQGQVWFAGDPVHAVSIEPPFSERRVEGFAADVVRGTLGHVLALSRGEVYEIDPVSMSTSPLPLPEGFGPAGALASDGTGRFVALDGSTNIAIYDVLIGRWAVREWSTSDPFQADPDLIDGTRDVAEWGMATYDIKFDRDPIALDWYQETPGGSQIATYVRFADSLETLPASRVTCIFAHPPADLRACHKGKRFARVEFMLVPDGGNRPAYGKPAWFGYP
jgi:hypothetical protein